MNATFATDQAAETRLSKRLMDVLIRAGLVLALAVLCYQIFSPFIGLMAWALILAVTLYPTHQKLARKMGGRQGLAATLLTLVGHRGHRPADGRADGRAGRLAARPRRQRARQHAGDSRTAGRRRRMADRRQEGARCVDARPRGSAGRWSQSLQPKIGALARTAVEAVASIAGAHPAVRRLVHRRRNHHGLRQGGSRGAEAIFDRIMGTGRGAEFVTLSSATIRAVALGVLGVAFIQAIVIGLIMLVAGVPFAGALALLVLVLGIAQVPALLVTLPVIVYVWASGDYGTGAAVTYSVLLFVGGMLDNVLKPLLLGRGVDAPMPVVLLGALGGLATVGHPGHVHRCDLADPGLPDLHVVGGGEPRRRRRSRADRGPRPEPGGMAVTRWAARAGALAGAALLSACTTLGPDFKRPEVPWLDAWTGGSLETLVEVEGRTQQRADARVVAPLQRSGARSARGRGTARQSERADGRPADHGSARPARHRRQLALSAGEAGDRRRASGAESTRSAARAPRRWRSAPGCAPAGSSTSGASSSAASRPPMPATGPASPCTTTSRC